MTTASPDGDRSRSDVVNRTPGVVTIWSDVACPWATLAVHNLRNAAGRTGNQVAIDHRVFPLELFNERPTPKAIVDAESAVLGSTEPALGWRPWSSPPERYPVTTLPAMEAVQVAKQPEVGGLAASAALDWALRRAFFVESRCISLQTEILAIARDCPEVDVSALRDGLQRGSHRARLFADFAIARRDGVAGSPHVFLPDGSGQHNPGVEHSMTRPDGGGYPVIARYDPQVWVDIVRRTTMTACPARP